MWLFIFGDMTVFALFFGTYLYYRRRQPELFADSQHRLTLAFGITYTLALLCSSLLVCTGVRWLRMRKEHGSVIGRPSMAFTFALACGAFFVALKIAEYSLEDSAGITPVTNEFYMFYFVLTGVHLFHLLIGIALLAYLAQVARRPAMANGQYALVEGGACYWHMVDLLWLIIFALLYLVK